MLPSMTNAPTPTRVALIGYGYAAQTFHAPLIQSVSGLSLALITSSRPELVHADLPGIAVEGDAMRAVVDPSVDLVVIATPNDTHFALAQAALRAGKHVVVDKPMTSTCRKPANCERPRWRTGDDCRCSTTVAGTAMSCRGVRPSAKGWSAMCAILNRASNGSVRSGGFNRSMQHTEGCVGSRSVAEEQRRRGPMGGTYQWGNRIGLRRGTPGT